MNKSATLTKAPMSVMDAIYTRRAVRFYAPTPVDEGTVGLLLDAAVQAPTAVREEPWAFVLVQDRETIKRLSDDVKKSLDEVWRDVHLPEASHDSRFSIPENVFYDAGTLIVICGKPLGRFVAADCWLATENLLLAARAMGLGTCVIGLAVNTLNAPKWKLELGIPDEMTAFAPVIVGTPSGETPATSRHKPAVLRWIK